MNNTPRGNRIHIGIFGRRNAGKSSLINALTGQNLAIVSDAPGTTADPVYKSMELHPIGPVVFIDTAGFDDEGRLGSLRVDKTVDVIKRTDIAIIVIDSTALSDADMPNSDQNIEQEWIRRLKVEGVPVVVAVSKCDALSMTQHINAVTEVETILGDDLPVVSVSAKTCEGMETLRRTLQNVLPEAEAPKQILGNLIEEGDLVLLVMPQDIQAPKGRLILPQVQTLRELLDRKCSVMSTTADGLSQALAPLNRTPNLIITDSQCFDTVYEQKPEESKLTSFSILMAASKGDIHAFLEGASAIDDPSISRVLIAEACTHVPQGEDIGTVKIPNLLRRKFGDRIETHNVRGSDFPDCDALKQYDLIIHCGGCMFNRRHLISRIEAAKKAGVPITNYGIFLAKLSGILDKVSIPV